MFAFMIDLVLHKNPPAEERKSKKSKYSADVDPGYTEDSLDVPDADVDIPGSASKQVSEEITGEDEFGARDLRNILSLKADHSSRPLWVVCIFWDLLYQSFHEITKFLTASVPKDSNGQAWVSIPKFKAGVAILCFAHLMPYNFIP